MCYGCFDESKWEWEFGGLMVDESTRGKGLGAVLLRLPLAHILFSEDPLAWSRRPNFVTHVLAGNNAPRRIIPEAGFHHHVAVKIPGSALPGLPTDAEGFVHGDEYRLSIPQALKDLAVWCEHWENKLRDGTGAHINLLEGITLKMWADALKGMAAY